MRNVGKVDEESHQEKRLFHVSQLCSRSDLRRVWFAAADVLTLTTTC
jgi:hypothetical protein